MWEVFKRNGNKFVFVRCIPETEVRTVLFETFPELFGETVYSEAGSVLIYVCYEYAEVIAVKQKKEVADEEYEESLALTSVPA